MRSPWVVQSVVAFTRLLLCVQGVFIAVIAWAGLFDVGPGGPPRTPNEIYALIVSRLGRHSGHQELVHLVGIQGIGLAFAAAARTVGPVDLDDEHSLAAPSLDLDHSTTALKRYYPP